MLPLNKKLRLISIGLSFSILLSVVVKLSFSHLPDTWNLTKTLDNYFYTLFFSPNLKPSANMVIIDSQDPQESRNRSEYAALVRKLTAAGAKCIAFDIRFLGQIKHHPSGDQELVNAVEESPQVILPIDFSSKETPPASQLIYLEPLSLPDSLCEGLVAQYKLDGLGLPFPSLLRVTNHVGHINAIQNEYYHFPLAIYYEKRWYASLPLEIARTCGRLTFADIPLDGDDQILVNFIPLEEFEPFPYSWKDAMEVLQEHPDKFSNAIVLVMNSSPEIATITPIGEYPKWATIASVTSQLLQNNHIESSVLFYPTLFSSLITFVGLTWFLFIAPRRNTKWRQVKILFLGGNFLFIALVLLLLRYGQQWIGVVVPLVMFNGGLLVVRRIYYNMTRPPSYLSFELTILERKGKKYPVKVASIVGEDTSDVAFNTFLEDEDFQNVINRVNAWRAGREELKWIGDKLFNAVFRGEVYDLLRSSLNKAKDEDKYLRLKLRVDAPELVCLPWEFMRCSTLPPGFLVLHRHLSLTRYLPLAQPIRKSRFRIPLRILVVISNPSDLQELDVEREKKLIKKSLRFLIWGGDVRLRFCENATLAKLALELERGPDILHYIGHGRFDEKRNSAFLEFESETTTSQSVEAEELGSILHDSTVKFVFLNSCEGGKDSDTHAFAGIAQSFVRVGVPAVLGMQFRIPDESAFWFANVFYSVFITNLSIDAAVTSARRYVMSKTGLGRQDWATPVLFMRSNDNHLFEF